MASDTTIDLGGKGRNARLVPLLVVAGLLALMPPATPIANACGLFFNVRALSPEQRPSLAREKVLIIHDAARGQEHFIREVAFRRAEQPFGFVVPTPTLPTVAAVEKNPFATLRERFPFEVAPRVGVGDGGSWEGVEVLSAEKVGSFTAFVLAVTDSEALAGWLAENKLTSTPETAAWLDHYVRMGFHVVALRYDPPQKVAADDSIAAETIRISFATPVAYYPYFEPEPKHVDSGPRLLELWYVGSDAVVPVARVDEGGWKRPFQPGEQYRRTREQVEAVLVDELEPLLPSGELVVQTFQDQKRVRTGFHDILFAFAEPKQLTPEQLAALEPLLGVLDARLIEERL